MLKPLPLVAASLLIFTMAPIARGAVEFDVNVLGVYTDDTFSTLVPGFQVDASGDQATAPLAPGNGIWLGVDIANPDAFPIQSIFTTLHVDSNEVTLFGGFGASEILVDDSVFPATSLPRAPIFPGPFIKSNSPGGPDEWIQATGFADTVPTVGTGPDINAAQILFIVNAGVDASQRLDFSMDLTQGDVVGDSYINYPTVFSNAVINVPEPSTALLFGLGLVGIATGRRSSR
jgi:hypothetical protein